jgi:hypothetical protein
VDGLGDGVPVKAATAQGVKDEEIQSALEKSGSGRFCHFPMTIFAVTIASYGDLRKQGGRSSLDHQGREKYFGGRGVYCLCAAQLLLEPGFGELPVAADGTGRTPQYFRGFFLTQSAKVS